ncbi:MAG: 1-acyl-sn-glycerol-3-phosphate acyltransferase [Acidimicrobiia bacterium]
MPTDTSGLTFSADVRRNRLPVAVGSQLLVGVGSTAMSLAAQHVKRSTLHGLERRWAATAKRAVNLSINVSGLDAIAPDTQYLVLPLHEGFADVIALLDLPLNMQFVVRDELFSWPRLGRYLKASHQIPIADDPTISQLRRLYRDIELALASGDSLVLFPQGSVLGIEAAFGEGALRIARRFNTEILPIVLTGAHRVCDLPFSTTVHFGQTIEMHVLPPIVPGTLDASGYRAIERRMKHIAMNESTVPVRRFVPERDGWWDDYNYQIDEDFPDLHQQVLDRRLRVARRESM